MADQIDINRLRASNSDGTPAGGAKATFFEAGTSTPVTVYADEGLATPHPSPLEADSAGVFAPIYFGGAVGVKVIVTDAADAALYTLDPARRATAAGSSASAIAVAPTSGITSTNVQAALQELDGKIGAGSPVVNKATNYTVAASDLNTTIRGTAGLTLALTAAATLGDGFFFRVLADGGDVVIDPAGSETINGGATLTVIDGQGAIVMCSGAEFFATVLMADSADADLTQDPDAAARRDLVKSYVDGRIVLETAVTTSGAAEYGFTGIAAGAKRITLSLAGVSLAGTDDMLVQGGDSGGYETSGYTGGSVLSASSGNDVESLTAGFTINTANNASNTFTGSIILTRLTGNFWVASGVLWGGTISAMITVAGVKEFSAELDRVRIKSSGSDNFDGGTVNVLVEY